MLMPTRKKVTATVVALLAIAGGTFAIPPVRHAIRFALLSPAEKRIVGEWWSYSIGGVVVERVRADHAWESEGGCIDPSPILRGRWRVDGSDLVVEPDRTQFGDSPADVPLSFRQPIKQIIDTDRQVRSFADKPAKK